MPGLGDILGGKFSQIADIFIYSLLQNVSQAVMTPYLEQLVELEWSEHPILPFTPSQAGQLVERGYMSESDGAEEAKKSGLDPDRFAKLWRGMRLPIAPQQAAEALRRGFIPDDSGDPNVPGYIQAIRGGDLGDIWAEVVKQLATQLPSPIDAVQGAVTNQLTSEEAQDAYQKFGGDPTWYDLLYHLYGTPPTPMEAGVLANRKIIPWTGTGPDAVSFEQVFHESHFKDKYLEAYKALQVYLPPPRTVVAMLKNGSLTDQQALDLLEQTGLSVDLATAYVNDAHHQKTQATKDLAKGTIEQLYYDQLIDESTATQLLEGLGYSANDTGLMLSIQDTKRKQAQINAIISKLRTLYISRKVDDATALSTLSNLGIPSTQVSDIMSIWKMEYAAAVQIPSKAEILGAFHYAIITQSAAQAALEHLGYSAHDAWLIMSEHEKGALPGEPPA